MGDAPPGLITKEIGDIATPEISEIFEEQVEEIDREAKLFPKGVIHHLSKEAYVWNFSLVYKSRNFDVIKWKTAFSWKESKEQLQKSKFEIEKGLFIGVIGGIFFFLIDQNIDKNYIQLAEMIDLFIQKTNQEAPFLVYGLLENKQKAAELKSNKDMLKNLADIKSLIADYGGNFKLENLKEIKMNLPFLIREYSHYLLTNFESTSSDYSDLRLNQVYFLDYEDLTALREIELSLSEQLGAGETVDELLSELFFKYLKQYKEEIQPITEELIPQKPISKPKPSVIKIIIEEIKKGIRRECPECGNNDRNKIREVLDKDNIIMENPNIYGFKYICGMCGCEFTKKDMIKKVKEEQKTS